MKLYRIKRSKIDKKGRGLYATCDIKEGTKIIDYVGKIITNTEVENSNKFDKCVNQEDWNEAMVRAYNYKLVTKGKRASKRISIRKEGF